MLHVLFTIRYRINFLSHTIYTVVFASLADILSYLPALHSPVLELQGVTQAVTLPCFLRIHGKIQNLSKTQ